MPINDPFKLALKFVGNDKLRPAMTGVYHKGGYIYATDALKILKAKADYPKSREGKILDKNMQPITSDGQIVNKYPNADAVIPDLKKMDEFVIDVKAVENALSKVTRPKKGDNSKKIVMYPEGYSEKNFVYSIPPSIFAETKGRPSTPGLATYDAWLFKTSILPFMKSSGADRIFMDKERSDARGAVITDGIDMALIMPLLNDDPEEASIDPDAIVYKTKQVGLINKKTQKTQTKTQTKTSKPTTMTRKRTTAKAHGSSATMRDASRILKAQKDDYKKIFAAEVKKSKDPKAGAKKAGKIYRDRYGATATARWKKALKRAK